MTNVGYLVASPEHLSPEEAAGWKFLIATARFRNTLLPFDQLSIRSSILATIPALWWHYDSSVNLPPSVHDPRVLATLRSYVERGGSLFLSLLAAQYVVDLGIEPVRPNFVERGRWDRKCWAEKYPDIRGLSSFQGHPVFNGLHGAAFTWSPKPESEYAGAFYEEPAQPGNGRVVAVEREYIKLNENWRVAIEYRVGKGRVLAIGSFMFFAAEDNRFRPHLELFTENCINYLAVHSPGKVSAKGGQARDRNAGHTSFWNFEPREVRFKRSESSKAFSPPANRGWRPTSSGLSLGREKATENFIDLGGRRILIAGTEKSGVEEVWAHPVRILKNTRIGFTFGSTETIWADTLQPRITVRPESLTRTFTIRGATIEETTFASRELPGGAIHFDVRGPESVEIIITTIIDLRIMWPLSERATGSLSYSWDDGLQAMIVHSGSANATSVFGGSLQPSEYIIGQYVEISEKAGRFFGIPTESIQIALGLRYTVSAGVGCTIVFAGSSVSERDATRAYRRLCSRPLAELNTQVVYFRSLLAMATRGVAGSGNFHEGYTWAVVATDRFFVETPGVGLSLMAGYALTRSGWDGGHSISGRAGYAWYFGRDSFWTALAMLAYGDFTKVRNVLEFLGSHQDITGKIAHEITTSGHVHYDAADATPLYLVLLGRYLRATRDIRFVTRQFPRLLKALDFCFSTDTDGDHLIENTGVGHGWVEGGPLFPAHAEIYLNACWCAALEEAAFVAGKIGRSRERRAWSDEVKKLKRIINKEFWDPSTGWYAFAKNADGTLNTTRTVLPTVAMYFGLTGPKKSKECLRSLASGVFSTDWGVRMIADTDPRYDPDGYHHGSIWPLFTGWTALAEMHYGLRKEGLRHLEQTLTLHKKFALGYIPEVLHGKSCELAGVCPHQAWSGALAVLGTITAEKMSNRRT